MFKQLIKIVLIILVGSMNIVADAESEFYLKIDLINREVSKDSNSQRFIVKVENKNVEYKYSYRGFPDNSDKLKTFKLSDKELKEIINYIKDNKINRSITEKISTEANGPSRQVHLSLLLKLEGETIETKISGNLRMFRANGRIKGEIIKNKKYVGYAKSLISYLKGLNNKK